MSKPNTRLIKIIDKIILGGICLLAFLLPVFVSPFTYEKHEFNKQFLLLVLVLIILLLWLSQGILLKKKLIITRTPLDYPILAFIGIYLLASIFSVNRINSFFGALGQGSLSFITIIAYALTYFLVVNNVRNWKKVNLVIVSLLASVFLIALTSILQLNKIFFLPFSSAKDSSFNLIGSLSSLVAFIGSLFPLLLSAVFFKVNNRKYSLAGRGIVIIGVVLIILLFNLINFRLGWYALIIGNFILLVALIAKHNENKNQTGDKNFRFIAIPALIFALAIFSLTLNLKPIVKTDLPTEISLGRSISWQIAQDTIKTNLGRFFFGSGPETFLYDFSQKKPEIFNLNPLWQIRFEKANNFYAEILATTGVLGLISLVVILLVGIGTTIFLLTSSEQKKKLKKIFKIAPTVNQAPMAATANQFNSRVIRLDMKPETNMVQTEIAPVAEAIIKTEEQTPPAANNGILIGLAASWMTLAVMHLFFSGRIASFFVLWLILGLLMAADYCLRPASYGKLKLSFKTSPKYALALSFAFVLSFTLVVVMFTYIGRIYLADIHYQKSVSAGTDLTKSENELLTAISLNKYRPEYYLALALNYLAQANQEAQKPDRDNQKLANLLAASLAGAKQGTDLAGNNVNLWESRGLIYQNIALYSADAVDWIIKSYEEVARLDPKNPIGYTELGKAYFTKAMLNKENK